jgi:glycosyltransferase involved in cell wall biosynthesis
LYQQILLALLVFWLLIQVGYALYYFIPFLFYRPPGREEARFPVSVIIAAHNEAANLQRLIPALLRQQYPCFEVLVVDDRSADDTKKNMAELSHNNPNLRILPIEHTPPGIHPKKYALTHGITRARYEHLLLTDADCLPASDRWIEEMAKGFFAETAIVLGYSPYIRISGFLNKLIRYETLLTALQYLSFSMKGHTYMGVGRNLAYTKTSFNQVRGFGSHSNILGGDDDLLVQQARQQVRVNLVLTKESQAASIPKRTYPEWFIQKRRHLAVGQHYKWADKIRIGVFMLANIGFYLTTGVILVITNELFLPLILLIGRNIVVSLIYYGAARKLKEELPVFLLPLLDIIYFINYLVLGVSVLMFKKVRWK